MLPPPGLFPPSQWQLLKTRVHDLIFNWLSKVIVVMLLLSCSNFSLFYLKIVFEFCKETDRHKDMRENIDCLSPACAPTRDQTQNSMCPDQESKPPPFGAWDSAPGHTSQGCASFLLTFTYFMNRITKRPSSKTRHNLPCLFIQKTQFLLCNKNKIPQLTQ